MSVFLIYGVYLFHRDITNCEIRPPLGEMTHVFLYNIVDILGSHSRIVEYSIVHPLLNTSTMATMATQHHFLSFSPSYSFQTPSLHFFRPHNSLHFRNSFQTNIPNQQYASSSTSFRAKSMSSSLPASYKISGMFLPISIFMILSISIFIE